MVFYVWEYLGNLCVPHRRDRRVSLSQWVVRFSEVNFQDATIAMRE